MAALAVRCVWPLAADAFQCPRLQAQIDTELGNRFDRTATNARSTAAEAAALHRAGKHEESVKMYKEAAKAAGMQLTEAK